MKYPFFVLLLFIFVFSIARGQQPDTTVLDSVEVIEQMEDEGEVIEPAEDYEEQEPPEPLFLPKDSMDKLRRNSDYAYMKNLDSMLRNLEAKAPEPEEPSGPSKSIFDIAFVKLIVWALAIFAVLFILYQLLAGQQNLFYKNKKLEDAGENDAVETGGLSPLIMSQQAAARGDFRMAIRYKYLYILQLMGEKGLVVLQPQKSDAHYQTELRGKPPATDFAKVTLQYEYVWYGEFSLNADQYQSIIGGYRKFIETWL
jgi:Domain of unknown function (DUF4129)